MHNKKLHMVAFLLLIVGGLNWGLEGLLSWGIGNILPTGIANLIYILVGLAAIYEIATHKANCSSCSADKSEAAAPEAE